MNTIRFTWDKKKAEDNRKKHGITFEEAKTVFYDENARLMHDPEHSEMEERFLILGLSNNSRLLLVVHCYKEVEEVIRIISARKATKNERKQYEEFLK